MPTTRRDFIIAGAAGGAGLILCLRRPGTRATASFSPSPFLEIQSDGKVIIWAAKSEMGQGVSTSLPLIVAEELEADWPAVEVRQADLDRRFGNQDTGGSDSVHSSWLALRTAGATAREMLVAAAAQVWGVGADECEAREGAVVHGTSGRRLSFGELAGRAAALPVPRTPRLKDPERFRLVGKRIPRKDAPAIVSGAALFGLDVRVPGMRFAVLARPPRLAARVASVSDASALTVPGVRAVVSVPPIGGDVRSSGGVAVIAETTWAAMQGRQALEVQWEAGRDLDQTAVDDAFNRAADEPGIVVQQRGEASRVLAESTRRVEATYRLPYLAHACMEPMNCTADVRPDRAELWAPTQFPQWALGALIRTLGLPPAAIRLHVTRMGGGFGRRINPDFVVEAAQVSRAAGAPVQVVWTREDDLRHDFYRPAGQHRLRAALDERGRPQAWHHRVIGPSTTRQYGPDGRTADQDIYGLATPYAIPHLTAEFVPADPGVPVGWWRSVAYSQNIFSIESFLDEVAAAGKRDPLDLRLELTTERPRLRRVLEVAADRSGWGRQPPRGVARGLAACSYDDVTMIALVLEVETEAAAVRVRRAICAIDCGTVVNPLGLEAQVEGSVVWGVGAALKQEITLEAGAVKQSNFHDYPLLRLAECPAIEVHIVPSREPPGGAGEPMVPVVAPALCNAVYAATGQRVRRLPVCLEEQAPIRRE